MLSRFEVLHKLLSEELACVDTVIGEILECNHDLLNEAICHLRESGGKRFRPALLLLTARISGTSREARITAAAAVEIMHMATLIHDDIVDNARLRRGRPTVNALWGNNLSILSGDFMFARAFSALAGFYRPEFLVNMSRVVSEMCLGEIHQNFRNERLSVTEEEYLLRIEQKTALFIAECCRLGAMLSGACNSLADRFFDYGRFIGMAFQITDDLLDLGYGRSVGKEVGKDLEQGVLTLPVIHALGGKYGGTLRKMLSGGNMSSAGLDIPRILELGGSIGYARDKARSFADKARDVLMGLPESPEKEALESACEFVLERHS
ncbi:MAG: polyprenyl synthetase family protein [Bacillota bacterium]